MPPIRTLYVVNHSHTDIGFTDFQDLCFRQHAEFAEQALDLCEATADYPDEARYRWACEVTGTTEHYFQHASPEQRDRFRHWHERGAIDVGGMQYNLTPMLNIEQIHRSLYPVRRLREEHGLTIRTAMQCDVNGISWRFADLLPEIGIDFLTMAINPIRGSTPKPVPAAFWWEGPAGGRILVWNGYHYLFGRSIAKLGDWRFVDESLPPILEKLENDPEYPYDFLYCQSTHPIRVDNGTPDARMPNFARDWNAAGRTPRIVFTTPSKFGEIMHSRYADQLPTWRGDWLDWWSDGVASSAYETGVSRAAHEVLSQAEALGAWLRAQGRMPWTTERAAHVYEQATLYDEHTWGAFASIAAPSSLWTKTQWNRKAAFAYTASGEAHDLLARGANVLARTVAKPGPEGTFNLGDLAPEAAYPPAHIDELLVINTLPWSRTVMVEEPEVRGGAAPSGVLDTFFPRDVPWGGLRPPTPLRRVEGTVPGFGYAFLPIVATPDETDLNTGARTIENAHYRLSIDPATGALREWFDKDLGHDFAGSYQGWGIGQYVYEWVGSPQQRDALFYGDFAAEDFGHGVTDTPFVRETVREVHVHKPTIEHGRASVTVEVSGPGISRSVCTYGLDARSKTLAIDWLLDKERVTDVEAVFVAFPFALSTPSFRADINGTPITPEQDQLPGTVRDWYPIQRWVDVSDGDRGVTLAPLDAPLVQLGGITSGRWDKELRPEGPNIVSWALQNHWMVNFKASQGGEIPLRYRLTTHAGPCDNTAAARFGAEAATPPIVMRDERRFRDPTGRFIEVLESAEVLMTAKPAEDGEGVILRLQNLRPADQVVPLKFVAASPTSIRYSSPLESDGDPLDVRDDAVRVPLGSLAVQSLRVQW